MAQNVTLSMDAQLLAAGREYARKHGTTLNSLIRHLLEQQVRPEQGGSGWKDMFALADKVGARSSRPWKREDLYER